MLKLGIIGHPVGHSLSPVLHGALLRALDLPGEYCLYDTPPDRLPEQLKALAACGVRGLNVTIPHKVAVMPLLDQVTPEAQQAGAVNTIVISLDGKRLAGDNTDIAGFVRGLPADIPSRLPESHVLVLGAGGAARAVLSGLMQQGVAELTVAARDIQKAMALLAHAEGVRAFFSVETVLHGAALDNLGGLSAFDGVVNTTPVGMHPQPLETPLSRLQLETLPPGGWVYDLIYRPAETQLLKEARALGLTTVNGLDMLLYQGVCALERWQPRLVPQAFLSAARAALKEALSLGPA